MKKIFLFFIFAISFLFVRAQNIAINTTGTAAAAANMFEVTQPASAATDYVGIFARNLSTATNAYAIWAEATGATNKYAIVVPSGGGNVGIGTTAPGSLLHLNGNPRPQLLIEQPSGPGGAAIDLKGFNNNGSRTWRLSTDVAVPGDFGIRRSTTTGGSPTTDVMTMDPSGNVGIGTTTPASLIHVEGAAQVGTASSVTGSLKFFNSASANATIFQAGNAASAVTYTLPIADGASGQGLTTNGSGTLSWALVAAATKIALAADELPAYSGVAVDFNDASFRVTIPSGKVAKIDAYIAFALVSACCSFSGRVQFINSAGTLGTDVFMSCIVTGSVNGGTTSIVDAIPNARTTAGTAKGTALFSMVVWNNTAGNIDIKPQKFTAGGETVTKIGRAHV